MIPNTQHSLQYQQSTSHSFHLLVKTGQQSKENPLHRHTIVKTSPDERNTAIGTNDNQRISVCTYAPLFVLRIVEDL